MDTETDSKRTDEQLLTLAIDHAQESGELPGRNELMRVLKVGPARANRIRAALIRTGPAGIVDGEIAEIDRAQIREALNPGTAESIPGTSLAEVGTTTAEVGTSPGTAESIPGTNLAEVGTSPGTAEAIPGTNLAEVGTSPGTAEAIPGTNLAEVGTSPGTSLAEVGTPTAEVGTSPGTAKVELGTTTAEVGTSPGTAESIPGTPTAEVGTNRKPPAAWPVLLIALPAMVAIWSGWVGLGKMTGFGPVDLLPGIDHGGWAHIDSAITLPIGIEAYAAYALKVGLSGKVPPRVRRFARISALISLVIGALGQVAYHLLASMGITAAPTWVTILVSCLPVACLGLGATLNHLIKENRS